MILPLGGPAGFIEADIWGVPARVKQLHSKFWFVYCILLVTNVVLEIIAADASAAIFQILLVLCVVYMLWNKCQNMSQCCLVTFGILVFVEMIFALTSLFLMLRGRTIEHTTSTTRISGDGERSVTVTSVRETHPFFDGSMGFRYNLQSAVKITSPSIMLIGVALAYWTYNEFPSGMFDPIGTDEADPMFGGPRGGDAAGGYGGFGGFADERGRDHHQARQAPGSSAGRPLGTRPGPKLFEGTGQRLGS